MNSKASIHTLESKISRYYRLPYVKGFIVLWGPLEVTTSLN